MTRSRTARRPAGRPTAIVAVIGLAALGLSLAPSASAATSYTVTASIDVGHTPDAVALDSAQQVAYVADADANTVSVVDLTTNTVVHTVDVGAQPDGIAVDPSTHDVYVANGTDDTVSVIDGSSDAVAKTVSVGAGPSALAIDSSTKSVYVSNTNDKTVSVIDAATDTVTSTITVGASPAGIAVDEAGGTVYVGNDASGSVSVIDAATNTVTSTVTGFDGPYALAVDPSSHDLFVANQSGHSVSVLSSRDHTITATITVGSTPDGLALDGGTLLVANDGDKSVSLVDTATNSVSGTVQLAGAPLAVAADSSTHLGYAPLSTAALAVIGTGSSDEASATTTAPVPAATTTTPSTGASRADRDSAPASSGNAVAAAKYLVSQLIGGTHLTYPGSDIVDYGGTADLAIALSAAGGQDGPLATIVTYLSKHVVDYADPAGTTADFPGPYSGAAAKLALLAEITGQDPTSFGGFDLLTTLTSRVCAAADTAGACTAAGDFYQAFSTVSQALGVLALARAGVTPPASTLTRLEQLQCSDGGFSSTLLGPGDTCTSDVDTTGFAVQALALVPAASASMNKAVTYLLGTQQPDGGFVGAAGENTNSTALAIQALLAASSNGQPAATVREAAARAAVLAPAVTPAASTSSAVTAALVWLAARQNTNGGFGISSTSTADDVRSTNQALPASVGATLTALSHPVSLTSAASGPGGAATTSSVGPATSSGDPSSSAESGGSTAAASDAGLATTGADVSAWMQWGLVLFVAGLVMCVIGHRRRMRTH